jgi:hypothetical protein
VRAILVSVDYTDFLRLTLPYNRHHFEQVTVVTSTADAPNVAPVAAACRADLVVTDLFFARGARFNKWAALERGLDVMGRHGTLCVMDADVLWPKVPPPPRFVPGNLYTPRRRVADPPPPGVPPESEWARYPLHRQEREFAGYSQIFEASDPVLGPPPWHQTDWAHAGGADSFFQAKWPESRKVRPPWECLHLGPCGVNWLGRASARPDGSVPDGAAARVAALREMVRRRRPGPDPFAYERL